MHDLIARGTILCQLALAAEGTVPEWIHLLPVGPEIRGRDGRAFRLEDAAAVIAETEAHRLSADALFAIDWEHASEIKAGKGEKSPAAGWVQRLEARADGIWARVEWTEVAANEIAAKHYRFMSPAFRAERKSGRVRSFTSAALTNRPNLALTQLNSREDGKAMNEEQIKALCAALGIDPSADPDAIITAAQGRQTVPVIGTMVPKADLEVALQRAKSAEDKLATIEKAQHTAEVDRVLNKAKDDGKIAPASMEQYRAMCSTAAGFEQVKALFETLPSIHASQTAGLKQPSKGLGLTEEQVELCRQMGWDQETYLQTLRDEEGGAR